MCSPREPLRVVIADDHPHYRASLARELGANGIEVEAEVPNATAAIAAVADHRPDVVILDLNMPGVPGVEAIRRLGGARVVVLTVSAESPDMTEAMLAGAAGYVLKDDLPEHIVDAVRSAADGGSAISPRAAAMLLARARHGGDVRLGRQQLDVLERLADGRPARSVREQLLAILVELARDDRRGSLRLARGNAA